MLRPVPRAPIKQRREPALAPGRIRKRALTPAQPDPLERNVAEGVVRSEAVQIAIAVVREVRGFRAIQVFRAITAETRRG